MLARMKTQTTGELAEITCTFPASKVLEVQENLSNALNAAGLQVEQIDKDDDKFFSVEEVFPEMSPGLLIEGLRLKFDITQTELAKRLGTMQNRVSDLETGKREVSKEMARKLGAIFQVPYKMFL